MRQITQRTQFRRDYKRQKRRGKDIDKLEAIVESLVYDGKLSAFYKPHKLGGEWKGFWECHIEPDWILIYDISDNEVLLARTGTHADLFE